MQYSIVIPVFNEESSINPLYLQLKDTIKLLPGDYEIIFVNDGSTDNSLLYLKQLIEENEDIILVNLRKRHGQTIALKEGFQRSRGKIIISLDGDLQNDPKDIPLLVKKLEKGFDAVCGWRRHRKDSLSQIITSYLGNFFQKTILKTKLHDISCTLRAYKKDCIKNIKLETEGLHRFIPYLIQRNGYRVTEVEINHRRRKYGRTKQNLWLRTIKVLKDFLTILANKENKP